MSTFLIIEDDNDLTCIIQNIKKKDDKVIAYNKPLQALYSIPSHQNCIVLLNVTMRDSAAWDILNVISENSIWASIPIILVSPHEKDLLTFQSASYPVFDFWNINIEQNEVSQKLEGLYNSRIYKLLRFMHEQDNKIIRYTTVRDEAGKKSELVESNILPYIIGAFLHDLSSSVGGVAGVLQLAELCENEEIEEMRLSLEEGLKIINKIQSVISMLGKVIKPFYSEDSKDYYKTNIYLIKKEITESYDDVDFMIKGKFPMLLVPYSIINVILSELVNNSLNHSKQSKVKIEIQVSYNFETNYFNIEVQDSGGGYPQDIIDFFNKTPQIYYSENGKEHLGLFLLSELAKRLKGFLFLSNSNKGSVTRIGMLIGCESFEIKEESVE